MPPRRRRVAPKAPTLGRGRAPATSKVRGPGTDAGARAAPRPAPWRSYNSPFARHLNITTSPRISRARGGAGRGRTSPRGKVFARAIQRCACGGYSIDWDRAVDAFGTGKHVVSQASQHGTRPVACCAYPIAAAAEHIVGDMTADPAPHSRSLPEVASSPYAAIPLDCTLTR